MQSLKLVGPGPDPVLCAEGKKCSSTTITIDTPAPSVGGAAELDILTYMD